MLENDIIVTSKYLPINVSIIDGIGTRYSQNFKLRMFDTIIREYSN